MKKILLLTLSVVCALAVSCKKDEIGGTATESMAGEWHVTAGQVDANGNLVYEDLFSLGKFIITTFNTSQNIPTEMFVYDCENFWGFQVKVVVDLASMTFATDGVAPNYVYESGVAIEDGKIMLGAATTPSGMPADSISFYVTFDDDDYAEAYGYAKHHISGYRYTGFVADN